MDKTHMYLEAIRDAEWRIGSYITSNTHLVQGDTYCVNQLSKIDNFYILLHEAEEAQKHAGSAN
jgi:hypothetical protein